MPSSSVDLLLCPSLLSALVSGAAGISSTGRGGLGQHGVAIGGPAPSGEWPAAKKNGVFRCLVRVVLAALKVKEGERLLVSQRPRKPRVWAQARRRGERWCHFRTHAGRRA